MKKKLIDLNSCDPIDFGTYLVRIEINNCNEDVDANVAKKIKLIPQYPNPSESLCSSKMLYNITPSNEMIRYRPQNFISFREIEFLLSDNKQ